MARFKNISGTDLRVGRADGPLVRAGDVLTVPGEVTGELPDAYIVGNGDDARTWPKQTWELIPEPKPVKEK